MAQAFIDQKPFVKGEFVTLYEGEYRTKVEVVQVDGNEVTVNHYGQLTIFTPRLSDGMFVKLGSPDFEVMPTMIYHAQDEVPTPQTFLQKMFSFCK